MRRYTPESTSEIIDMGNSIPIKGGARGRREEGGGGGNLQLPGPIVGGTGSREGP